MNNKYVISGANVTSGGPLEIFRNVLNTISGDYPEDEIIAIVNNASLFDNYPNVKYVEIKNYKKYIFLKFYYEYIYFYNLSKKLNAEFWLSLNDCSPSIKANRRAVYCHNPSLFYNRSFRDFLHPSRPFLQSFYYALFYRINIKKNDFIIVQQNWLKLYFHSKLNVPTDRIVIHRPFKELNTNGPSSSINEVCTFIYPTKAEYYKNIDVIIKACYELEILSEQKFQVIVTINGSENKYARSIINKAKKLNSIKFIGFQTKENLHRYYCKSSCLIFSSFLETWGLPISEFQELNKPIIVSDLPYARENAANYDKTLFFDPSDETQLANCMLKIINKAEIFDDTRVAAFEEPLAFSYSMLMSILLNKQS